MDKRIVGGGVIVLLIGLVFLGLAYAYPISLDSTFRRTPVVANMMMGKLDITVVVVTPSWSIDLINTNTGASITAIPGVPIPIGTHISFKGRLTGTDGLPITSYWIHLNLLGSSATPESGNQCWVGSSQTDSNGYFGSGKYIEVRADGWYTTYAAEGYADGYVQVRNGAGNPGCQTWATQNPSGKAYAGYAAVSSTYYSNAPSFSVATVPPPCPVTGDVYVNDLKVSTGGTIRSPPAITFAFVPTASASSIQTVTLKKGSTDIVMPYQSSGAKYVLSQTWATGTYTVGVVVTCTGGSTQKVLNMAMDVGGTGTQAVDPMQELSNKWAMFAISLAALGVVVTAYGYKKHE